MDARRFFEEFVCFTIKLKTLDIYWRKRARLYCPEPYKYYPGKEYLKLP